MAARMTTGGLHPTGKMRYATPGPESSTPRSGSSLLKCDELIGGFQTPSVRSSIPLTSEGSKLIAECHDSHYCRIQFTIPTKLRAMMAFTIRSVPSCPVTFFLFPTLQQRLVTSAQEVLHQRTMLTHLSHSKLVPTPQLQSLQNVLVARSMPLTIALQLDVVSHPSPVSDSATHYITVLQSSSHLHEKPTSRP